MRQAVKTTILVAAAVVALAGCREFGMSPRERGVFNTTDLVYAIAHRKERPAGPHRFTTPFTLAVAQVGEHAVHKNTQEALKKSSPWIRGVISVPLAGEITDAGGAVRRIQDACDLAADLGADYLLVFGGGMDVISKPTWLMGLDITLVGSFIMPSYRVEASGRAVGALIDLKTNRVVFIVSADAVEKARSPTLLVDAREYDVLKRLRDALVERLVKEFADTLDEAVRRGQAG